MCFMEWGSWVGSWFLWQQITAFRKGEILVRDFFRGQKVIFRKNGKFQMKMQNFKLSAHKNIWLNLKIYTSHIVLV